MKTDVIAVSSDGNGIETALEQAELVASYKKLNTKSRLQLRLLAEEVLGMMHSITGEANGKFWIEDEDNLFSIHLTVDTWLDNARRDKLIAASSSGKNEAAKGIMGKIRDLFDRAGDGGNIAFENPLIIGGEPEMYGTMTWSLYQYRTELANIRNQKESAQEAWDELEKSVVANVADEVKVSIRTNKAEMIVEKKFA